MIKVLYKPAGMLVSVLGGVLAGAIFKQVWKVAFSEDDAPRATDADRSWRAAGGSPFALLRCGYGCERGAERPLDLATDSGPLGTAQDVLHDAAPSGARPLAGQKVAQVSGQRMLYLVECADRRLR